MNNTCTPVVQKPDFGGVSGMVAETNGGETEHALQCAMMDHDLVPIPPVVSAAWAGSRNSPAFGMLCNLVPLLLYLVIEVFCIKWSEWMVLVYGQRYPVPLNDIPLP